MGGILKDELFYLKVLVYYKRDFDSYLEKFLKTINFPEYRHIDITRLCGYIYIKA